MDNIGKFGIKRINAMISRRTSRERRERVCVAVTGGIDLIIKELFHSYYLF